MMELSNARTARQLEKMKECLRLGRCPFCQEYLAIYHDAPILIEGKFWVITANDDPYEGTEHHYLAISKRHITSIEELSFEEAGEQIILFAQLAKQLKVKAATTFMRFGEIIYTGATIDHLHAHFIVGSQTAVDGEKLKVKVGFKKPR